MKSWKGGCFWIWLWMWATPGASAHFQEPHLLRNKAVTIVPDNFLRAYDPVTVFFNSPRGPEGGGTVDEPGDLLQLNPAHPGEYRWIDARTLQFLPTIPWPALARITVRSGRTERLLVTLMAPPSEIAPAPGSADLEPLQEMILSFDAALEPERLARMITLEVRALPGLESEDGAWLTDRDFRIKPMERVSLKDPIRFRLTLNKPVPYGRRILLHLRLSLDDRPEQSFTSYSFSTKPLFRLDGIGAGAAVVPVAVNGSVYARERAFPIESGSLDLRFSDWLGPVSLAEVKHLVRFEPAVRNFSYEVAGKNLRLAFEAESDRAYKLTLEPTPIRDRSGRTLAEFGETSAFFYTQGQAAYLRWRQASGILERHGPQQLPMEGRDETRLDVRIFKIDPLSRNFWPFPAAGLVLDESVRPAGPGEEPSYATDMAEQIRQLGTPLVSRILSLPLAPNGPRAHFGLDLSGLLAEISGPNRPGTYLVGYRALGSGSDRHFARVQVTDLCLTTVEEENAVLFAVTSLAGGDPIEGAEILLEGFAESGNQTEPTQLLRGTTDATGWFRYEHRHRLEPRNYRIIVTKGEDRLVLDPRFPPPQFYDDHWFRTPRAWLDWLNRNPASAKHRASHLVHLFSERPVYRPEEPVYLKGYLRVRRDGELSPPENRDRNLIVTGPGDRRWTYPIALNGKGAFHHKFEEKDLPSGDYSAFVQDASGLQWTGFVTFKKEAYRIPRFEVRLSGPDRVPLDRPFELLLTADYYAGGRVAGQHVTWEITRFPYRFQGPDYPGYLFSTDERFSEGPPVETEGGDTREDTTDEAGSAKLSIDPTRERDSRAKRYVIEATVRGADEQTVSTTKSVLALPPFLLGVKLEKVLKDSRTIRPEVLVLGTDGKPLAGQEIQIRLLQRQWHSYLRESDFTTGEAQYVTEVVDEERQRMTRQSAEAALPLAFEVGEAGVYLVEVAARDQLGRLQKVQADVFVPGDSPVSWQKPRELVFESEWDQSAYAPGDTARLILKSPFQRARALIVVEEPRANRYYWIDIRNGQGLFSFPVTAAMTPRLPVHVLLSRGRLDSSSGGGQDHGKPITMASTAWLRVKPKDFQIELSLDHPEKSLPGSRVVVEIGMKDPDGQPLNGEATLWLVDRAVLALGTEARLDPVPAFLEDHRAWVRIRDTRNDAVGALPLQPFPGGDGAKRDASLFGKVTVRRNFQTVPYYQPQIPVVNGRARVEIPLPDNLTDFAVRAVATDGGSRFGFARSTLSIRLPVIVQSAMPRFVRPGDRFTAGGIGRVVEGEGGAGSVEIQADGLSLAGPAKRAFQWKKGQPEKLFLPMTVTTEAAVEGGEDATVLLRVAVKRDADGAADAFELKLPVKKDRDWEYGEWFMPTTAQGSLDLPMPEDAVRPGTLSRTLTLTGEPALVKMLAALQYLDRYPHGCTEQRVSKLFPDLAMSAIFSKLGREYQVQALRAEMDETLFFLEQAQQSNGLFGYWPNSRGYVSLTGYVVEFLTKAKARGFEVKPTMLSRAVAALKEALRTDYANFIEGYLYQERVEALAGLSAAGEFDESYGLDMAARGRNLGLYSESRVLYTLAKETVPSEGLIATLRDDLRRSLVFANRDGRRVFQGLQYRAEDQGGPLHAGLAKAMAGVARALYRVEPENPEPRLLIDALVSLGENDGWGSTQANAAALLALGEVLDQSAPGPGHRFRLVMEGREETLDTTGQLVTRFSTGAEGPARLVHEGGSDEEPPLAWISQRYLSREPGEGVRALNAGFVLDREVQLYDDKQTPPARMKVETDAVLELPLSAVVEEHIRVVNPEDRFFVAVRVPFAAGLEPMNPNLATAPKEARPVGRLTREPDYALFEDDRVTFYFDHLPKGSYDFYFRLRASIEGSFVHPAARVEMMYRQSVYGRGAGARVVIQAPREE